MDLTATAASAVDEANGGRMMVPAEKCLSSRMAIRTVFYGIKDLMRGVSKQVAWLCIQMFTQSSVTARISRLGIVLGIQMHFLALGCAPRLSRQDAFVAVFTPD